MAPEFDIPGDLNNPYDGGAESQKPLIPQLDPNRDDVSGMGDEGWFGTPASPDGPNPDDDESELGDDDEDTSIGISDIDENFDTVEEERDSQSASDLQVDETDIDDDEIGRLSSGISVTQNNRADRRRRVYSQLRRGDIEYQTTRPGQKRVVGMGEKLRAFLDIEPLNSDNRADREAAQYALEESMQLWDIFRQTGIALDVGPADISPESSARKKAVRDGIEAVGELMRGRKVAIGNISTNNNPENQSKDKWMLPVDKLLEAIRFPTNWKKTETETAKRIEYLPGYASPDDKKNRSDDLVETQSRIDVSESRNLTLDELATMLGISGKDKESIEAREALGRPGAGISHTDMHFLLGALAEAASPDKEQRSTGIVKKGFRYFPQWKLFGAVDGDDWQNLDMKNPLEALELGLRRGQMRDRFIIETFGKDAFPLWFDRTEGSLIDGIRSGMVIDQDAYDELETLGRDGQRARFLAQGRFDREDGSLGMESRADDELIFGGMDNPTIGKLSPDDMGVSREEFNSIFDPGSDDSPVSEKVQRGELNIEPLLDYFGIQKKGDWRGNLRQRLVKEFGKTGESSKVPGFTRDEEWSKSGVPTAWVQVMIQRGIIPSASAIWKENRAGERLDDELSLRTAAVTEALLGFINRGSLRDSEYFNPKNIQQILKNTGYVKLLRAEADARGPVFEPKKGDAPRYSRGQLQDVVNRFNEVFGTEYTIDDIFSDEQLRQARQRIENGEVSVPKPVKKANAKIIKLPSDDGRLEVRWVDADGKTQQEYFTTMQDAEKRKKAIVAMLEGATEEIQDSGDDEE